MRVLLEKYEEESGWGLAGIRPRTEDLNRLVLCAGEAVKDWGPDEREKGERIGLKQDCVLVNETREGLGPE